MSKKKYFWLKLNNDFFEQTHIKFLRKMPDGDKLVIVYLKMQLKSLKNDGMLYYEGILDDYVEELALNLDEDKNIVKLCLFSLEKMNLIEIIEGNNIFLSETLKLTGSESQSAERVRKHREQKEQKVLHCNTNVTLCNKNVTLEKEKEIEKRKRREEKELEIEIEIKKEKTDEEFDIFYKEYGTARNKNSWKLAWEAWQELKKQRKLPELAFLLEKVRQYKNSLDPEKNDEFKNGVQTWLNRERWNDDFPPHVKTRKQEVLDSMKQIAAIPDEIFFESLYLDEANQP